jgi:hypothetical protein
MFMKYSSQLARVSIDAPLAAGSKAGVHPTPRGRRPAPDRINIERMVRLVAALAAALALSPPAAAESPPAPESPPAAASPAPAAPPDAAPTSAPAAPVALPRGAVLEEVSGTVREVDRKAHTFSVDTPSGAVKLSLDRNTMVYTAAGLGTVLDVKPGVQIRAGRNSDALAYWVQVRGPQPAAPASTPGQGTGPAGGGSAPAGESTGPGAGSAPTAPTTGPTTAPGAGGAPGT